LERRVSGPFIPRHGAPAGVWAIGPGGAQISRRDKSGTSGVRGHMAGSPEPSASSCTDAVRSSSSGLREWRPGRGPKGTAGGRLGPLPKSQNASTEAQSAAGPAAGVSVGTLSTNRHAGPDEAGGAEIRRPHAGRRRQPVRAKGMRHKRVCWGFRHHCAPGVGVVRPAGKPLRYKGGRNAVRQAAASQWFDGYGGPMEYEDRPSFRFLAAFDSRPSAMCRTMFGGHDEGRGQKIGHVSCGGPRRASSRIRRRLAHCARGPNWLGLPFDMKDPERAPFSSSPVSRWPSSKSAGDRMLSAQTRGRKMHIPTGKHLNAELQGGGPWRQQKKLWFRGAACLSGGKRRNMGHLSN